MEGLAYSPGQGFEGNQQDPDLLVHIGCEGFVRCGFTS